MKMRIQLIIENESGVTTTAQIAALERRESDELIGISLEEAKSTCFCGFMANAAVRYKLIIAPRARDASSCA
jgi:hypothetical protein